MKLSYFTLQALLGISAVTLYAEDYARIVLLEMPSEMADTVRSEITGAGKGAPTDEMDKVLKKAGVTSHADFKEVNPWRSEEIVRSKATGKNSMGGVDTELELKVTLEGERGATGVVATLDAFIQFPKTQKGYLSFDSLIRQTVVRPGIWQEWMSWEGDKKALILWQFVTPEPETNTRAAGVEAKDSVMRIEMLWFQATPSDLAQLEKAQPENRDKASQWLAGRAKLWKGCGVLATNGNSVTWSSREGKLVLESGEPNAVEGGLYIEGGFSAAGGRMTTEWEIKHWKKTNGDESVRKLSVEFKPGRWDFSVIEGMPDANVVLYRLSEQ